MKWSPGRDDLRKTASQRSTNEPRQVPLLLREDERCNPKDFYFLCQFVALLQGSAVETDPGREPNLAVPSTNRGSSPEVLVESSVDNREASAEASGESSGFHAGGS